MEYGERKMELAQEEKAARLQKVVLNSSVEEISKLYDELGNVEMSAPALGLACRFRGLDAVKVLVGKGATFDFPSTEETEIKYHCHIGGRYRENYRTNYSLYLLKCFRGGVKGARCLKGMRFEKNAKREDDSTLPFLTDKERIAVLGYLIEKKQKLSFQPEEMLFYAIFAKDTVIYEELKKWGITLSEKRIYALTEGVMADGYWFEFGAMTKKLADQDYIEVMQLLSLELQGKPFRFTEKMFDITKKRFQDINIFAFFLAHFRQEKMKKYQMIRGLIDENALDALTVIEKEGWLAAPKKRDEMIAYATQNKKTEALVWLLDFKNRTADLAAEQEKADKKLMRELNATPDSVTAFKQIWNYRKREDGTLIITNYKGTRVEVVVPKRIGKNVVTAIGRGAFAGDHYKPGTSAEQIQQHQKIKKIVLPETIQSIGKGAFHELSALEEINIPQGVREIDAEAFHGCRFLKGLHISKTVEKIGEGAFYGCRKLEELCICEDMQEISDYAFYGCASLKKLTIPQSVKKIGEGAFFGCNSLKQLTIPKTVEKIGKEAFATCRKLRELRISEGVREIEKCAFFACQNVKHVTIPKTVEKVGEEAFADCRSMEEVQISEGVREIEKSAFQNCFALKDVTIPGTVDIVGEFALSDCRKLEKVYFCEGVQEIGAGVFFRCDAMKEVHVPKSVERFGFMEYGQYQYEVFDACPNLTVYCPQGSKVESYCEEKQVRYQSW